MSSYTGPFYRDNDSWKALEEAARSWLGTPFRKGASIKGAGVDCVNLAAAVYRESNFNPMFDARTVKYSLDGGRHCRESKLINWLNQSDRFTRDNGDIPRIGDLIVFRMKQRGVEWHCGVMIGVNVFVHAIKHHGVVIARLDDPTWKNRLSAIYRPTELFISI